MDYPLELLPQPGFCVPFPFDALKAKYGNYIVCYRIEGTIDENSEMGSFNGHKVLKEQCFGHMVHLSMNLMGGFFKPEHVVFIQKRPGSDVWEADEKVDFKDYEDCIEKSKTATAVYYRESVICQPNITISFVFNDKAAFNSFCKVFQDATHPQYKDGVVDQGGFTTKIEHCPTNLNYWHVQLEVYPELKEEMLKNDHGVWRSRVFDHIRSTILCHKFEASIPFQYEIPKEMYQRS